MKIIKILSLTCIILFAGISQSCEQKPLSLDQKMEILKNDPDFIAYCQLLNKEAINSASDYYGKDPFSKKINQADMQQFHDKVSKMKDVEELKASIVAQYQSQGMLHAQEFVDYGFNVFKYSKILFDRYDFLKEMSSQ